MKPTLLLLVAWLLAVPSPAADPLEAGFASPPAQTKPWCYWYWITDNISKEGLTHDLEAMARVGIGEALVGNVFLEDVKRGKVKVLSPEWWSLVEHAIREGGRVGVNVGLFNCPGWSQSGGPWIKSSETMRYLATSETRVTGPAHFVRKLAVPKEPFQDVVVLAFPAPAHDGETFAARRPQVTATPAFATPERLVDGDASTVAVLPAGAGQGTTPLDLEFALPSPMEARSLRIVPGGTPFAADVELQAAAVDGSYQTIRRFKCDRSNMSPSVGFLPRGPVTISFPATTAQRFRLRFSGLNSNGQQAELAEIELSAAASLESYIEKQLGKMHPVPLPMWDAYLWPTQPEPDSPGLVVPVGAVRDLTKQLSPDGTLKWDVPAGEWVIQRIGMTPTGMKNTPASPEGAGFEVDKLNGALARRHFEAFIGEVLRRIPASDRKAFKRVVADSYEMGSQNWTDGLESQFQLRYGYDPRPWLPVLGGRLVGSADQSERFLWDLRRLVADRVATDYVGGLRAACAANGLQLWLENYGHWGFPSEFLKYGGASDRVGGEYWVTGDLGSIECRAASSCANTYGKPFVSAEAFTGGPAFQNAPSALKARGDWSFCEGVNHFVLHVYIHQPYEERYPGINAWFGTEFDRHNTWFEDGKAWVDYLRRSCWLLQQGQRVADVAYFIGEDAPKMTGARVPELPPGRDFDYINAEVIETKLAVRSGRLVLPHGTSYALLVLPPLDTMRPGVLRKVRELIRQGATVYGTPPLRSPSMENYPQCDAEVRQLASAVWGEDEVRAVAAGRSAGAATPRVGERAFGKGRVMWGRPLAEVLAAAGEPADFEASAPLRFTHRRSGNADIYFVASPKAAPLAVTAAFRAGDRAPEFWWPDSGRIEQPAVYQSEKGRVQVPVSFGPHGSVFVVFRDRAGAADRRIVSVQREGRELLGTTFTPAVGRPSAPPHSSFAFAVWVNPAEGTALPTESSRGASALGLKRNDLLAAPHGNQFAPSGHAGCGLAVGTNGVCVLEHSANYFAATLAHAAPVEGWTHVAVVYRDGQASLYLNGSLVRTGLRSQYVVHSGAGAGPVAQFNGQSGEFSEFTRPLTDTEVAELARAMPKPRPFAASAPMVLTRTGRELRASVNEPGDYLLQRGDGTSRHLVVGEMPEPKLLDGAWEVSFTSGLGAPSRTTFTALTDWAKHADPSIRHYAGRAVYRRSFELSAERLRSADQRWLLDLGTVRDLATVRLNGQTVGTLWLAPFQCDISKAAKSGVNTLEVEVVNVWNNRLVGDAALPASQRQTWLAGPPVRADAPLQPAGLLGPVVLRPVRDVVVP